MSPEDQPRARVPWRTVAAIAGLVALALLAGIVSQRRTSSKQTTELRQGARDQARAQAAADERQAALQRKVNDALRAQTLLTRSQQIQGCVRARLQDLATVRKDIVDHDSEIALARLDPGTERGRIHRAKARGAEAAVRELVTRIASPVPLVALVDGRLILGEIPAADRLAFCRSKYTLPPPAR